MNLILQIVVNKFLPKNVNFKKYSIIFALLFARGALTIFYGVPMIVKTIVTYMCTLKPGHFLREKHEKHLPFTYKLYLWNVTNPDEISAGTEKPKMQDVGPYVFRVIRRKVDTTDNVNEDTYSFDIWNHFTYDSELSAPLTGNEMVTIVNLVLVSAVMKIKLESRKTLHIVTEGLDVLFNNPQSLFITMKAIDFINKGIEVDCNQTVYNAKLVCTIMRRAKTLKILNEEETLLRYRWFDKANSTKNSRYTVSRGVKNTKDVGIVRVVNGKTKLKIYNQEDACNIINGTVQFYPPFQRKGDVIWNYSEDACKSFPLRFNYMKTVRGAKTAWKSYDPTDPLLNHACECNIYTGCSLSGSIDMYQCLDIFVLGTLPHFYLTDPSILSTMEGMMPNEKLHSSGIYTDLLTGTPVRTYERFQISWLIQPIAEYRLFSTLAGDAYIPVLWYEESFELETSDLVLIIFSRYSKIAGILNGYLMMIVGVLGSIVLALRFQHQTSVVPINVRRPSKF